MTTIEGEVIATLDVLPPDVQTKVSALSVLSGESQSRAVTALLSHSRAGLLAALAARDLPQIMEWKAKGAAIQEIVKQLRLGKELQDDAAEFSRRSERGLGVAIREGQRIGAIASKGQRVKDHGVSMIYPSTLLTNAEMFGDGRRGGGNGIYAMTDNVSDGAFEEAITEARREGNLSRANVARKAKAKANTAVADPPPQKNVRKTASARKVMEDIVVSVNGLVFIINDTDPREVDLTQHKADIEGIRQGLNIMRRFLRAIEEGN